MFDVVLICLFFFETSPFKICVTSLDDGAIESLTPGSIPVTDAIVESLDIASTVRDQNTN